MQHSDPPNVLRAKFILGPLAIVLFFVFIGTEVKNYLSQLPILTLKINPNLQQVFVPTFCFSFPWGSIINQNQSPIQAFSVANPNVKLTDVFDISMRSFDNYFFLDNTKLKDLTIYLLVPKKPFVTYDVGFNVGYNLLDILPPGVNLTGLLAANGAVASIYTDIWIFGRQVRFSEKPTTGGTVNSFGIDPNLNATLFDPNFSPIKAYQNLTGGHIARDTNPFIRYGQFKSSTFSIGINSYTYINQSREVFYSTTFLGGSDNFGRNLFSSAPRTQLTFNLQNTQRTEYSESYPTASTAVMSSAMAAFQFLLITGFIVLFGRGKYSPYGLVHFLVPGTTIPTYKKDTRLTEDELNRDKINFFVAEYLDTTPMQQKLVTPTTPMPKKSVTHIIMNSISMACAGTALVLFACCIAGGIKFESLYFLKIRDPKLPASDDFKISIWGFCDENKMIAPCHNAGILDIFGNFGVSSSVNLDPYPVQNWWRVLNQEHFGLGFMLLALNVTLILVLIITKIGSTFMSILRTLELVVLPIMSIIIGANSIVALILFFYYYVNLQNYINSELINLSKLPNGSSTNTGNEVGSAQLGNLFWLLVLGTFFVLVLVVLTQILANSRFKMESEQKIAEDFAREQEDYNQFKKNSNNNQYQEVAKHGQEEGEEADENLVRRTWTKVSDNENVT
ncbi:hypothetical protein HDU92_003885 [Lobulomyces angularis]|nr:hypothetical protein HDU92_003885 [Lobulomyces angularis]